jgi:WW domain-binding protein 4
MTTSTARNENDEYVFDDATGYFKHKVSGIFYDPNSGLFYNAMTSTWYSWSESKQEYTVVNASSAPVETRDEPKAREVKQTPIASRVVHATISSAPVVHKPLQPSVRDASVDDEVAAPKYRDRANERRTLHDKQSEVAASVTGRVTGGRVRTPKT